MPRIPCEVISLFSEALAPFVSLSIVSKSPPVRCGALALIDTGSPYTGLSPKEVLKSRIRMKGAKGKRLRLAGQKFVASPLNGARLNFRTEDGDVLSYEYDGMTAFIPTKTDSDTLKEVQSIPTIIGTDFLETFGLALFFDAKSEVAYLEAP
jgi:hypothetical protein